MLEGEERRSQTAAGFQVEANTFRSIPALEIYHCDQRVRRFKYMSFVESEVPFLKKV